jgi:uncharacterized membrane protein YGL010W
MKTLQQHLSAYGAYHRDRRNVITHFIGIPLIVLAVVTLLSRPAVLAVAVAAVLALYYLILDRRLGLIMTALLTLSVWIGNALAALPTHTWLAVGIGGFVIGWVLQFIGHVFEGRKPAFIDDIMSLAIGPLFVVVEALFACGLLSQLKAQLEAERHSR